MERIILVVLAVQDQVPQVVPNTELIGLQDQGRPTTGIGEGGAASGAAAALVIGGVGVLVVEDEVRPVHVL